MKITFLGAGSTVFARNVLGDCLLSELKDYEIALYDIDERRLDESYVIITAMRDKYNKSVKVDKYTDAREAFRGANYIVTPTEKNTKEAVETCKQLGRALGFKMISELSTEKHDEMIGFLSQMTHCIAVSLMVCKESEHLADYTGDSFRDLTRIAKINDEMWSELFLANKDEIVEQMNLFEQHFDKLKKCIESDDREGIREMMRLSTKRRKVFDKCNEVKE